MGFGGLRWSQREFRVKFCSTFPLASQGWCTGEAMGSELLCFPFKQHWCAPVRTKQEAAAFLARSSWFSGAHSAWLSCRSAHASELVVACLAARSCWLTEVWSKAYCRYREGSRTSSVAFGLLCGGKNTTVIDTWVSEPYITTTFHSEEMAKGILQPNLVRPRAVKATWILLIK